MSRKTYLVVVSVGGESSYQGDLIEFNLEKLFASIYIIMKNIWSAHFRNDFTVVTN